MRDEKITGRPALRYSIFTVLDHYPGHARTVPQLYEQVIAEAQLAEELGYDTFFIAEHHFREVGSVPSPAVFLAALARETSRIRLGVAVANLAVHNPITVAENYAMADVLSGGRLTLGVGSGYLAHEYAGHHVTPQEKRQRFDENLQVLKLALSGGAVTFKGKYNDVNGLALNVRPMQQPLPPLYVAIRRRAAAYHVGRQGHAVFSLPCTCLDSFAEIAGLVGEFRRGYRESGAPGAGEVVLAFHTHVAASDAQAKARGGSALNLYFDTRLAYKVRQDYDMVLGKGLALLGSPATVAQKLVDIHALGVDHVMCLQNFGGLAPEDVRDSMRLLATDAIPRATAKIASQVEQRLSA